MEKTYRKIEKYLKEQFPKKEIKRLFGKPTFDGEIWGTMGMPIMVYNEENTIYYRLITKNNGS